MSYEEIVARYRRGEYVDPRILGNAMLNLGLDLNTVHQISGKQSSSNVLDRAKEALPLMKETDDPYYETICGLVTECERLQENQCTPEKCYGEIARLQAEMKITSERATHNAQQDAARERILREELAKWQKIANTAIDHNASERAYMAISAKGWSDWKTLKEHDPETANVFIEQATRELGIAPDEQVGTGVFLVEANQAFTDDDAARILKIIEENLMDCDCPKCKADVAVMMKFHDVVLAQSRPGWEINEKRIDALKVAVGDMELSKNINYLQVLKAMLEECKK